MRRLILAGAGALAGVVVAEAVRRMTSDRTPSPAAKPAASGDSREPYPPAGDPSLVGAVLARFRSAMAERERDLVASLLVTPQGGDAGAVFGRRRDSEDEVDRDDDRSLWAQDASPRRAARHSGAAGSRPTGRVDDDDPLYDF